MTVTDANGCSATDEADVIVHPLPVASIAGASELCITTFIDLVATGGDTYSWGTGETSATITVSPSISTDYHVTVTDVNGCTATASHHVAVNENDQADAGPDQQICIGDTTQVTASGGDIFFWNTGETTSTIVIAPSSSITYSVTVTDDDGCTDEDEVLVVVNPLPNAHAGPDEMICDGESVQLIATGGVQYLWNTGDINNTLSVTPAVSSTYTVTVTDANGCSATDEADVIVHPLPVASIAGASELCITTFIDLVATGGDTFSWDTGETSATITVSPSVSTDYHVTVTDVNGCTSTASHHVAVNENDQADAGPDQQICVGETTQVTASGCLLYTSPSPRDGLLSRMPSSA